MRMGTHKHTPGPWKLDGGKGKRGELYVWSDRAERGKGFIGTHEICMAVVKPNGRCEGGAAYWEEEHKANALLIAAAPELLARLEQALRYLEHPDVQAIPFALSASVMAERCREAVRKATAEE